MVQMANDPKMASSPRQVREKIVVGKLNKFYAENCLLQQEFVKDNTMSIEKYIASAAKALGGTITFKDAVRFEKGEGHREEAGELRRGDRLHGEGLRIHYHRTRKGLKEFVLWAPLVVFFSLLSVKHLILSR